MEVTIVRLELNENRSGARIRMDWPATGSAQVAVQVTGEAKPVLWSGNVDGTGLAAMKTPLNALPDRASGDFEVKLKILFSDGQATVRSWDIAAESESLRNLRRKIELAGHIPYFFALAYFEHGRSLQALKNHSEVIAAFRSGLDELGDLYSSSSLQDDTGMKLVLAQSNERKGALAFAEAGYERVLESRLKTYAAYHKLQ